MAPPHIVFGAGSIGTTASSFTYTWDTPESVSSFLSTLSSLNLMELDSAAAYPPGNPGNTEILLGQAKAVEKGFLIDSKVDFSKGRTLNEETISKSLARTLESLGSRKIRTLYAHFPDPETPVEETARAFDGAWKKGGFERLGICNYSVEQVQEYFDVCDKHGYVKPTVYQGHYNPLLRHQEERLVPLLRKHNCAYYGYSPLAGGFLTGKVTFRPDDTTTSTASNPDSSLHRTRWEGDSELAVYTKFFNQPAMHDALRKFKATLDGHNARHASSAEPISLTEASLRLVIYHSALRGEHGDAIILGAKREEQLKGNLEACRKGPLPEELARAGEEMWRAVRGCNEEKDTYL